MKSGWTQRIEIFLPAAGALLAAELLTGAELLARAELTGAALDGAELAGAELLGGPTAALLGAALEELLLDELLLFDEPAAELPAAPVLLLQPARPNTATRAIPATLMGNLMPILLLLLVRLGHGHQAGTEHNRPAVTATSLLLRESSPASAAQLCDAVTRREAPPTPGRSWSG